MDPVARLDDAASHHGYADRVVHSQGA
jgi:hypothetical protein